MRLASLLCLALAMPMTVNGARAEWHETVLYSFEAASHPETSLVFDAAGSVYGTTSTGGVDGRGTVFRLTPPEPGHTLWHETAIHTFDIGDGGRYPLGGVTSDANGTLYGRTEAGGKLGAGAIFSLSPPAPGHTVWRFATLYTVTDAGIPPYSGLTLDKAGNIYGVGSSGSTGEGAVFEMSPPGPGGTSWKKTTLHDFDRGHQGLDPDSGVILDPAGNLYGTTVWGGSHDGGTLYRLTPPDAQHRLFQESVLHDFTPPGSPYYGGLALDAAGNLYGVTTGGGAGGAGTVYELSPPTAGTTVWKRRVLYSFGGRDDGSGPVGNPVFDAAGNIYGVTIGGGRSWVGTVFRVSPPADGTGTWTETVLYSFRGRGDGGYPAGNLALDAAGNVYGVAGSGGSRGGGVAFKLSAP